MAMIIFKKKNYEASFKIQKRVNFENLLELANKLIKKERKELAKK